MDDGEDLFGGPIDMVSPLSAGAPAPAGTPRGYSQVSRGLVVSGTFVGGVKVDLFNNNRDKCCLCIVSLNELGAKFCGGLIGTKGAKVCLVKKTDCGIAAHKSLNALCSLTPKAASSLGRYVLIGVPGKKDQAWTTFQVPFESIEAKWDTLQKEYRPAEEWSDFLRSADANNEEQIAFTLARVEAKTAAILATGKMSPRKRLRDNADRIEALKNEIYEDFTTNFHQSVEVVASDQQSNAIAELQMKVQVLAQKLKNPLVAELLTEVRLLDEEMVSLTNKVGFATPDTEPRTLMEHILKLVSRVDEAEAARLAAIDEGQEALVRALFNKYGNN